MPFVFDPVVAGLPWPIAALNHAGAIVAVNRAWTAQCGPGLVRDLGTDRCPCHGRLGRANGLAHAACAGSSSPTTLRSPRSWSTKRRRRPSASWSRRSRTSACTSTSSGTCSWACWSGAKTMARAGVPPGHRQSRRHDTGGLRSRHPGGRGDCTTSFRKLKGTDIGVRLADRLWSATVGEASRPSGLYRRRLSPASSRSSRSRCPSSWSA